MIIYNDQRDYPDEDLDDDFDESQEEKRDEQEIEKRHARNPD